MFFLGQSRIASRYLGRRPVQYHVLMDPHHGHNDDAATATAGIPIFQYPYSFLPFPELVSLGSLYGCRGEDWLIARNSLETALRDALSQKRSRHKAQGRIGTHGVRSQHLGFDTGNRCQEIIQRARASPIDG